jgi:hypothetical protein
LFGYLLRVGVAFEIASSDFHQFVVDWERAFLKHGRPPFLASESA